MANKAKRDCFVVGPIGAADSTERIHADWVLEEIITPVMDQFPEFVVHRSDKLNHPGQIDTQMIDHLLNDDLVIADMTTSNANAFYEIGIRHMVQKPIIHMHKKGEKIPFDVSLYRSLEFSLVKPSDLRDARALLKDAVQAVFADGYKVDNPITHARGVLKIHEQASDPQRVLLDAIEGLTKRVGELETKSNPPGTPKINPERYLQPSERLFLIDETSLLKSEDKSTVIDLLQAIRKSMEKEEKERSLRSKPGPPKAP
jgi:hypothetical protein